MDLYQKFDHDIFDVTKIMLGISLTDGQKAELSKIAGEIDAAYSCGQLTAHERSRLLGMTPVVPPNWCTSVLLCGERRSRISPSQRKQHGRCFRAEISRSAQTSCSRLSPPPAILFKNRRRKRCACVWWSSASRSMCMARFLHLECGLRRSARRTWASRSYLTRSSWKRHGPVPSEDGPDRRRPWQRSSELRQRTCGTWMDRRA